MEKVTKKDLNERLLMIETLLGLHRVLPEQISNRQAQDAIFRMQCALSSGKDLAERESKPKVLDQSVFDGLDKKWRFAAVDSNGDAVKYTLRVEPHAKVGEFVLGDDSVRNGLVKGFGHELVGTDYDATDWQNSLIERDKVELTGSDLCMAILDSGNNVMCIVNDFDYDLITAHDGLHFIAQDGVPYEKVVPINNQGEPLTATDVGL